MKNIFRKLLIHNLTSQEKIIIAIISLVGMLEIYDFTIYSVLYIYFAHYFFPESPSLINDFEKFTVFFLGFFIARPIGAFFFGHFGDKQGRKDILTKTTMLMGVSSLTIGLLPSYNKINIFAPVLILLLRFIQGLSFGGGMPVNYVYLIETLKHKIGSAFAFVMVSINVGLLLAISINKILNLLLTKEQVFNFGCRIPFIFGGAMSFAVYFLIKNFLKETDEFNKISYKSLFPILSVLKYHFKSLVLAIGITASVASLIFPALLFMPVYLSEIVHVKEMDIGLGLTLSIMANLISIYIVGSLSNYINHRKLFTYIIIIAFPVVGLSYYLISINFLLYFAVILLGLIDGAVLPLVPLITTKLFPTSVRLTGVAISYNIGFTIFSGLLSLYILNFLEPRFNPYVTPVLCIYIALLVSLSSVIYLKQHKLTSKI